MPLFYATADKSRLVAEDDPEATFVVNSDDPGEFAALLKAARDAETAKATQPKAETPKAVPAARRA